MREISELIAYLGQLDIKIWLDEGRLKVNGPKSSINNLLKEELSARKDELINFILSKSNDNNKYVISKLSPDQRAPLTYGQERIWSLVKINPDAGTYHIPFAFRLIGKLDLVALGKALTVIHHRHDLLRTVFQGEDIATAHQVVKFKSAAPFSLADVSKDLALLNPDEFEVQLNSLLETDVNQPFDIVNGPLWRARLFQIGVEKYLLSFTFHHLIFDGFSKNLFLDELLLAYDAASKGSKLDPKPFTIQYGDFSAWQKLTFDDQAIKKQLVYWEEKFQRECPSIITPNDFPRNETLGGSALVRFSVPKKLIDLLSAFNRAEGLSAYITCLAFYFIVFHRFYRQSNIYVCSPTANRDYPELEKLIGYFNNVVLVGGDLSGDKTFKEFVSEVRKNALGAFDHQNVPLQFIQKLPNLIRVPLTRAMFSFQEVKAKGFSLGDVLTQPILVRKSTVDFELGLNLEGHDGTLEGVLDYDAGLFSKDTAESLAAAYIEVMERALDNPNIKISDLPVFGPAEDYPEKTIEASPKIDQCFILRRRGKRVAFVVLNEHDVPTIQEIRKFSADALPDYLAPDLFIPLDDIPLDVNGDVDVAKLETIADQHRGNDNYVQPSTSLEYELVDLWKKTLWIEDPIGVNDRFKDLGGHSLLWVQLITELEKKLQTPLSTEAISANTIAEMAAAIESGSTHSVDCIDLPQNIYRGLRMYTSSWDGWRRSEGSLIVGMNVDGKAPRLFWCLQRYQELEALAMNVGPDNPIYGMRSGNYVMVKSKDNIKRLASYYLKEILEIQSTGPFFLGGNCQASIIALEIAKQLKALGYEVSLLFMMEKFVQEQYDSPLCLIFGEESDRNPFHRYPHPEFGWSKYFKAPFTYSIIPGQHGQFFKAPNVKFLAEVIKKRMAEVVQKNLSGWRSSKATEILVKKAYMAELNISSIPPLDLSKKQAFNLSVKVRNKSQFTWLKSDKSGIFLVARLLTPNKKEIALFDATAKLESDLDSGASVNMVLNLIAPPVAGVYVIQIDLADQGISWFSELGSVPLEFKVKVD